MSSSPRRSNSGAGSKGNGGAPVGKTILGVTFKDDQREQQVLATVNEWYRACKNARAPIERQWYINLAFHAGRQNIRMVATPGVGNGFKLQVPKAPPWRVRLVVNHVRKYVRTELARIVQSRPRFFVVPATSEDEDLVAARVAEQIFDSVYSNYSLKDVIRQAQWWNVVCGTGYTKTYWDAGRKDQYSDAQGDLVYEPITPFNIYVPNLLETKIQNQPYVIHATTKTKDWVELTFPELKGKVNADANSTTDILDSGFLNVIGARSVKKEEVLVLECWVKPGNKLFPNGGMVIIVGGQIASINDKFPYKHKWYPFQKYDNIESGRFYTTSALEDLIPLQRELNRTRSQIIECVDEATEILTKSGWKRYTELELNEEVLTFNSTNKTGEWQKLQNISSQEFEGELHKYESSQISALVTDKHRWLVQNRKTKQWYHTDQRYINSSHAIPISARCSTLPTASGFSDAFCELLGWVATDGSYHSSNYGGVYVYQSRSANEAKCKRLLSLFDELGINPNECEVVNKHGICNQWYIGGDLGKLIIGIMPNKLLDFDFISSLTESQLRRLLLGLVEGDGCVQDLFNWSAPRTCYSTTDKELADAVQIIGTLLGMTTSLQTYKRPRHGTKEVEYRVNFKFRNTATYNRGYKGKTPYEGNIWCPTVENGYWYARRNGKVFITGNSKNMMSKPKLLAASGSIEAKQITSEPGQTIYYKMGYPTPTPLPLVNLPAYVLEEVQQLKADMDDLMGQHEITKGQYTAATALSFLKEQDDTVLSGIVQSLESGLEDMGKQTLGLISQFWDTPRMVRVVGQDATFDAQEYRNSSIGKNQDVRVESGSALPQSKAAKQAFVMDLLKMGLIPPQEGLDMLDIGGIEKIYEDYLTDKRQAQRENQKMMMNIVVESNDFDNHQLHIEIHNKFRKGQQYEALDPQIQELFQQHVMGHQQALNSGLQPGGQFPDPMAQPPVGNQPSPQSLPGGVPGGMAQQMGFPKPGT